MRSVDTTGLAARLLAGKEQALKEVEALGLPLPGSQLAALRRLSTLLEGQEVDGLAYLLALVAKLGSTASGLLVERVDGRYARHVVLVRWLDGTKTKLTIGVGRADTKTPAGAWPELAPWSRTLEKNRARLEAWATTTDEETATFEVRPFTAVPVDDDSALRAAIVAAPDDDQHRLVYADWLLERGDVRGELIQLQLELARSGLDPKRRKALTQRADALLEAGWSTLAGDAAPFTTATALERGFVDRVTMTVPAFLKHGEHLFSSQPIRALKVDCPKFAERDLTRLGEAPALARVRSLELAQQGPRAMPRLPLKALARSTHLSRLQELRLNFCGASPDDWAALFRSLAAPALEDVGFHYNHGAGALYRALATNPAFAHLRRIQEYRFDDLDGDEGSRAMVEGFTALARHRPSLKSLDVSQADAVTDAALTPFFDERAVVTLEELRVNAGTFTDKTAVAIASSPHTRSLKTLQLTNGQVTIAGVTALLSSPNLASLEHLDVRGDREFWPEDDARLGALRSLIRSKSLRSVEVQAVVLRESAT